MSKADQIRALREAAATAAPKPAPRVFDLDEAATRGAAVVAASNRVWEKLDVALALPAGEPISYTHRDADKRRAYMKAYMARKRAETKAARG